MSDPRIGVIIPQFRVEQLFVEADKRRLEALGRVTWSPENRDLSLEEAGQLLADCTIGVGSWGTVHPGKPGLLDAAPQLRLWEHAAGSVRFMFTEAIDGREITIASCAPAIAEGVAEYTLGEIIAGLRRIIPNSQANRAGGKNPAQGRRILPFATIGVVGASSVGRAVIRMLKPFGCRILVFDPFLSAAEAEQLDVEKVDDLTALCAASHAVTLHTPSLPATRHMMAAEQFQAMPDDGVFINTSRGSCVDEAALIAECRKGRLMAFLDVSDPEPAADDSPLRQLPNVIYTSHIAGGATPLIGRQVVDDIEAFLAGRSPKMAVTSAMLERIA